MSDEISTWPDAEDSGPTPFQQAYAEADELDDEFVGTGDPADWSSTSWPRCYRHNPQRVRHAVSFFVDDGSSRSLELHVPLGDHEMVCDVHFDENPDEVRVRVIVCCTPHDWEMPRPAGSYRLCPASGGLLEKLREKRVVDMDTGEDLPWAPSYYRSNNALRAMRRGDGGPEER